MSESFEKELKFISIVNYMANSIHHGVKYRYDAGTVTKAPITCIVCITEVVGESKSEREVNSTYLSKNTLTAPAVLVA